MHFPPFWNGRESESLCELLSEYGIKRVYFGHIHGVYDAPRSTDFEGISMTMISADFLNFVPMITMPCDY